MSSALPVVLDVRVMSGSGGGPEKTLLNSPRFLLPLGYRMLCAYMHPPREPGFARLQERAAALAAPLISVPDRGPLDFRVLWSLLRICRRERVAVWHGHDYKSNFVGLLLRPFWPMRLVTTLHGWVELTPRTEIYYRLDRLCLPRYERVISVSEDLLEHSLAAGVTRERSLLLENGIDTAHHRRRLTTSEAQRRVGLAPGRRLIVAAGRLSAEKGFDVLLRAFERVVRGGVEAALWIAGEGRERGDLERLARELALGDRCRLLGYREDVPELLEAADIFALSSHREGLPNALLEAMALETPVVATRVAGIPRVIEHDVNGLLVSPASADELASALLRLLGDPGRARSLAQAARRTVEQRYSFDARMRRLARLYDALGVRAGVAEAASR